jgi:hypothetical protein
MAFITTLFVLFAVGMMLIGFVYMTQNEAFLAGRSRNASIALGLAEAGIQEALARLRLFTIIPGSSSFTNSLASNSPLSPASANRVQFQAPISYGGQKLSIYPITSTATFGSAVSGAGVQRIVRAYVLATFKPGASNVIFTPQANFNSNAVPVSGDSYTRGSILFQSGNVPQCAAGASPTNLPSPQVFAGTTIQWNSIQVGCGVTTSTSGTYTYECGTNTAEVAPTACPGGSPRDPLLPYNMHPMVPIGMPQADFITVLKQAALPPGITLVQAAQSGTGVTYPTPTGVGGYPATCGAVGVCANKVILINTASPNLQFCVNSSLNAVTLPPCVGGAKLYGDSTLRTRFIDWGLIDADTASGAATTFFQAPMCTAPCPNPGYQNGVRYIPLPVTINVQSLACNQNVNPGTNVVDNTAGVALSCGAGITIHNATTETFTGTKSNPESLIILNNPGSANAVTVNPSLPPGALPAACTPYSWFDSYNWGQILSTGDITVNSSLAFSGFIYTQGNLTFNSDTALWGAVYSTAGSSSFLTLNSTTTFCGGSQISMLNPLQMNYSQYAWQDPTGAPGIR